MERVTAQDWLIWGAARRDSLELEKYLTTAAKRTESAPFKRCGCCQKSYSAESWSQLRFKGVQPCDVAPLEYRDCVCGSTIAVVIDAQEQLCNVLAKARGAK